MRVVVVNRGRKGDKGDKGDTVAGPRGPAWSEGTSDGRVPARSGTGTVDATLAHVPDSSAGDGRLAMTTAERASLSTYSVPATQAALGSLAAAADGTTTQSVAGLDQSCITTEGTYTLTVDGDSLTHESTWTTLLAPLLTVAPTGGVRVEAVDGQMIIASASLAYDLVDKKRSNCTAANIVILWSGTNDLHNWRTPETALASLIGYCRERKARGAKVVVVTLPTCGGTASGGPNDGLAWEAINARYNGLVRASFLAGTLPCDAIADIALDANLGASGAWANATYFNPDGVHCVNAASSAIVAGIVANAVNGLVANYARTETNHALGKTYTFWQPPSGSFPDSGGQLTDGVYAADDYGGQCYMSCGWNYGSGYTPWILFDLGQLRNLHRFRVHYAGGHAIISTPGRIRLQTSSDGITFTTVFDRSYTTDRGGGANGWFAESINTAPARYLKLHTTARLEFSWWGINEFEAYGY